MIKTKTQLNFDFNKVTGAAFTMNLMGSFKALAELALDKVLDTFKTQKDINGKKFAKSTYKYLIGKHGGNPSSMKSNKIMVDQGRLRDSIVALPDESNLEYSVGTPLGEYEKHLERKVRFSRIVDGKSVSYSGYKGNLANVPQRKFFFTSAKEAYDILEPEIERQADKFIEEFLDNLSTPMRKIEDG